MARVFEITRKNACLHAFLPTAKSNIVVLGTTTISCSSTTVASLADLRPPSGLRADNSSQDPGAEDDFWAAAEAAERKETRFRGGEAPETTSPRVAADASSMVASQAARWATTRVNEVLRGTRQVTMARA